MTDLKALDAETAEVMQKRRSRRLIANGGLCSGARMLLWSFYSGKRPRHDTICQIKQMYRAIESDPKIGGFGMPGGWE